MKKNAFSLTCLFLFILALAGCSLISNKDDMGGVNQNMLEPSALQKFNDVPVPTSFKIVPQNSYCFECSGIRVGVLRYQGKATPDQVVSFYKEQMPMYNWTLLNVVEYGERMMNFDRENETCVITMASKGNTVFVTVSLGPKPQTATPTKKTHKSEKPIK